MIPEYLLYYHLSSLNKCIKIFESMKKYHLYYFPLFCCHVMEIILLEIKKQ